MLENAVRECSDAEYMEKAMKGYNAGLRIDAFRSGVEALIHEHMPPNTTLLDVMRISGMISDIFMRYQHKRLDPVKDAKDQPDRIGLNESKHF